VTSMDVGHGELLRSAESLLDEVDAALGRLADGTYGVCALCGSPIPDDELATTPTARSCGRHAQ
jgi:DnaK suppressor protein